MASYRDFVDQDVRLIILRALADETDFALNENLILAVLETFGHRKTRDYVRNQLAWLAEQARAVTLTEAGSVRIATLTQTGLDHVERRAALEGVKRRSPDS